MVMLREGRILGIDYGEKRIGVAVSDPMRVIAQGLPTIENASARASVRQICAIVNDYEIVAIVMGLPLTLKGDVSATAKRSQSFGKWLQSETALPVTHVDERFTSVVAERTLQDLGKSPSRNRAKVDQMSAILILQGYLNQLNATPS